MQVEKAVVIFDKAAKDTHCDAANSYPVLGKFPAVGTLLSVR